MGISLHASALAGDDMRLALPIIQATWAGIDMTAWLNFGAFFNVGDANRSGILALRDAANVICGVAAYRLEHSLEGREFLVHLFTAVDLANSLTTIQALLDAITVRARQLRCQSLKIRLDWRQADLADRLRALGLADSATLFRKPIDPTELLQ